MKGQLNKIQSRSLAVILLLVCLGLLYLLLVEPYLIWYQDNTQDMSRLNQRLARLQMLVEQKEELQQSVSKSGGDGPVSAYYFTGKTQALVAADLQASIKTMIDKAGGSLISTQPLTNGNDLPGREVQIRVRMLGDISAIRGLIYSIEANRPLMLLDNISIRKVRQTPRNRQAKEQDSLEINFDLIGFMQEIDNDQA